MNEYKNPYHSLETNLEIAIGAIQFRDMNIENLRAQIKALRRLVEASGMHPSLIDACQYEHLLEKME